MLLALILALTIPNPASRSCVTDTTGALPGSWVNLLEQQCRQVDQEGIGQIGVLVVNDLQGSNKAEFANETFKKWGIGHQGKDDGILILLVLPPAQRGIQVEVGYGLEGVLPDGRVMQGVREKAIPVMKSGDYGKGLYELASYLIPYMRREHAQIVATAPVLAGPQKSLDNTTIWILVGGCLAILALGLFFAYMAKKESEEEEERARERLKSTPPPRRYVPPPVYTPDPPSKVVPPPRRPAWEPAPYPPPAPRRPPPQAAYKPPVIRQPEPEPEPVRVSWSSRRDDDSSSSSSSSSSSDSGFGGFDGGSSGGGGGGSDF